MDYYSFLPYLRQGLSTAIQTVDNFGNGTSSLQERVNLTVTIPVNTTPTSSTSISKTILLKGPGDIIGINSQAVIRVSPADWVTNMEPNYLPFIEFYDEDFPWRYTPAQASVPSDITLSRLRPWMALVVLEESEFLEVPFNGIVQAIQIEDSANNLFPDEKTMWAWAHVHVNADLGSSSVSNSAAIGTLKGILKDNPEKAVSRILCPRKLKPNTSYHAFLIPTFETGRRAGLGETNLSTIDAMKPSWTIDSSNPTPAGTKYPVYYRWFFKTGAKGDFESLVTRLQPFSFANESGKREVDMQLPGHVLIDMKVPSNKRTLKIQGILKPPGASPDLSWPPSPDNFTPALAAILNTPKTLRDAGSVDDPVISPPIYGQWHNKVDSVSASISQDWLHMANLDPRYRIFAGAGAEVVRQNQEEYMRIAWEQVGEVIEANKKLRNLQVAEQASKAMYTKHVAAMTSNEDFLSFSGNVHTKAVMPASGSPVTVYKTVKDSVLPDQTFSGAFRRITRPGSTMMRAISNSGTPASSAALIADLNAGNAALAAPISTPTGIATYNVWPASSLTSSFTSSLPTVSNFTITSPGGSVVSKVYGPPNSLAAAFAGATASFHGAFSAFPAYNFSPGPSVSLNTAAQAVRNRINPGTAILDFAKNNVALRDYAVSGQETTISKLDTIMAAPQINLPMYKELARLSTEWLLPGLNDLPQDSVSLLQVSQAHIEAYMLGMNHEMSRELLWRGYPTDQRGTYFSFFWGYESLSQSLAPNSNLEAFKDIRPIHTWVNALGYNSLRSASSNFLVVTVRGELLRKYPGTFIYLHKAKWKNNNSGTGLNYGLVRDIVDPSTDTTAIELPVFYASLKPDIYFIGFKTSPDDARGVMNNPDKPGYYIVFQENVSEVRFGADEMTPPSSSSFPTTVDKEWNNLTWNNIQANSSSQFIDVATRSLSLGGTVNNPDGVLWAKNSAGMAYILLQLPVRLHVHANSLLPPP